MTASKISIPQLSYEKIAKSIIAWAQLTHASNREIAEKAGLRLSSVQHSAKFLLDLGILDQKPGARKKTISQPLGAQLGKSLVYGNAPNAPKRDRQELKKSWKAVLDASPFFRQLSTKLQQRKTIPELITLICAEAGYTNPHGDIKTGAKAIIRILVLAGYIAETQKKGVYSPGEGIRRSRPVASTHRKPNAKKTIFISCGQTSQNEIALGKQIKELVERPATPGYEGYFAENQQDLRGLTHNIFNELDNCSALIAVMHRRERLSEAAYRGSVWIEQEVAIASFIRHTTRKHLPVKAYIQDGIKRDGVRQLIQLNPITFENDSEVLEDLRRSLPAWLARLR